jgi:hypothetical protein
MATLNASTLVTYNAKTAYAAKAGHNARLVAGLKALTANGTKAVTVAHLTAFLAAQYNNPQFVNYGYKMAKQPIMPAPKTMPVIVPTQKQLTPPA